MQESEQLAVLAHVAGLLQEAELGEPAKSSLDNLFEARVEEGHHVLAVKVLDALVKFLSKGVLSKGQVLACDLVDGNQHSQIGVDERLHNVSEELQHGKELLICDSKDRAISLLCEADVVAICEVLEACLHGLFTNDGPLFLVAMLVLKQVRVDLDDLSEMLELDGAAPVSYTHLTLPTTPYV